MPTSSTGRHVVLGAGPVGRAVAAQLVGHGETPVVVSRTSTALPGAETRRADVCAPDGARHAVADAGVVYQCTQPAYTRWPEEFPALQGSIVDAVATTAAVLVVVENLYGYGPVDGPLHERLPLAATTRKGAVRAAMWQQLADAHDAGRVRAVAARASDFFGPGVEGSAVGSRFFEALLAGKPVEVLGDPAARHSLTYVPDLAAAMVRLAEAPDTWGRAWHVPNAPAVRQTEFAALAARVAGVEPRIRHIGPVKLRLAGLFVPEVRETVELFYEFAHDFVVDHGDWTRRFGTEATSHELALTDTIAWWRDRADHAATVVS